MKFKTCFTVSLFFLLLDLHQVEAQTATGKKAGAMPALLLGLDSQGTLPHYALQKGKITGYAREVFDHFAKTTQTKLEFKTFPTERLYAELIAGKIDLIYPDNPFWEAELKDGKSIVYSDAVVDKAEAVFVSLEQKGREQSQLKTLAVLTGVTPWVYLTDITSGKITRKDFPDLDQAIRQTAAGTTDGAYLDVASAYHHMRNSLKKPRNIVVDAELPYTRNPCFLSTIKHADIIETFNLYLKEKSADIADFKRIHQVEEGLEEVTK